MFYKLVEFDNKPAQVLGTDVLSGLSQVSVQENLCLFIILFEHVPLLLCNILMSQHSERSQQFHNVFEVEMKDVSEGLLLDVFDEFPLHVLHQVRVVLHQDCECVNRLYEMSTVERLHRKT